MVAFEVRWARIGRGPQDTALPEGNRSGGSRQRGTASVPQRSAIASLRHHAFGQDRCPLAQCVKLRGFGGRPPSSGAYPGSGFCAGSPAFLARWLAPSNSRMMAWCTKRSMAAIVVIGSLKIWSHWLKTRFELMRMLRRS